MKIVLTGISATPYAREYISNAAATLRGQGHEVFVPHEGGWQAPDDPAEANRFDFEQTFDAVRQAELLMAVLDGYTVDDAVAFQMGAFHAYAREGQSERSIIGILHDTRIAGWEWTAGGTAVNAQIRLAVEELGQFVPNFRAAFKLVDEKVRQ